MTTKDVQIMKAMAYFGGSFVKALAACIGAADEENLQRIKETWPEYWEKYSEMLEFLNYEYTV